MVTLIPHLWFATEAAEAAAWYASLIPDSRVTATATLPGTPGGDSEVVQFVLAGRELQAISAGPLFRFTPAISLMLRCPDAAEVDRLYHALSAGGEVLMELGGYPFSPRYGWVNDRYGVSWQVILDEGAERHGIHPALLFAGPAAGRAREAIETWTGVIPGSAPGHIVDGDASRVAFAEFTLAGVPVTALDDDQGAPFTFTEAVSLLLRCDDQAEIDRLSDALSAVPEAEQCGWIKDRFGVSWQIVPAGLDEALAKGSPEEIARVTAAFLTMRRFDVAAIERARLGE